MNAPNRRVVFLKGAYTFQFTFPAGCEAELVSELTMMAVDDDTPFDWCDATVLSHQLGRLCESQEQGMVCAFLDPV